VKFNYQDYNPTLQYFLILIDIFFIGLFFSIATHSMDILILKPHGLGTYIYISNIIYVSTLFIISLGIFLYTLYTLIKLINYAILTIK
jgi:hypothetical protein